MVAKRKTESPDEFQIVTSNGTYSFRAVLLLLVLSATPFGQLILKNLGITSPALEVASAGFHELKTDIQGIKNDVRELKSKTDKLEYTVTGFQIDFEKYRKTNPPAKL